MYCIFDFDGTLIDSFDCVIAKFNILADEFNFRKLTQEQIKNLKDLNSRDLIKHLQIPFYKIPIVLHRARKSLHQDILTLKPFEGIAKTLQMLVQNGNSLGILTSNSKENVEKWLVHHQIHHLFNFIHAGSNYFGKKRLLKNILKQKNIDKSRAFYIGDETRDIEAAKQCDIAAMAVTWGFNSEETLLKFSPDFVVRSPEDLLKIVS